MSKPTNSFTSSFPRNIILLVIVCSASTAPILISKFFGLISCTTDQVLAFSAVSLLVAGMMTLLAVGTGKGQPPSVPGTESGPSGEELRAEIKKLTLACEQLARERHEAEEELTTSRNLLFAIIDNASAMIYVKDRDGRYIVVNRYFEKLFNVGKDAVSGRTNSELFPSILAEAFREIDISQAADSNPGEVEEVFPFADGPHTYLSMKFPLFDAAENPFATCSISTDITGRKQAEQVIREMADQIRLITDSLSVNITYLDRELRYQFVNRRYRERFGISSEKIIGKTVEEVVGTEQFAIIKPYIDRVLLGEEVSYVLETATADGGTVFMQIEYLPHLNEQGEVVGFFGQFYDITEQKQTEAALRASEERYRLFFETTGTAMIIIEGDDTLSLANTQFVNISGYNGNELKGKTWTDFVHPDHLERVLDLHRTRRGDSTGTPTILEFDFISRNGSVRNIAAHLTIIPGTEKCVASFLDITQRKKIENALQAQLDFLQVMIDTIPNPIFYKDLRGRYLGFNNAFEEYIGMGKEELLGKSVYDIAPPELADKYYEMDEALFRARGIQTYRSLVRYADGTMRDVIFNKATFNGKEGTLKGLVGVMLDITDNARAERLLSAEKRVLSMIVNEAPLPDVLQVICTTVEELSPQSHSSVLLKDPAGNRLRHAAAPTLPEAYCKAIDGTRIGAGIGSCGTAAFTRQEVIVSDIENDPLWAKYRQLPLSYGLRACWSKPILSREGDVLGTFAIYFTTPRIPNDGERSIMERAVDLASIVIERKQAHESLRVLQLQQQAILDNIPDMVWLKDEESTFITVNRAFADACGMAPEELTGKRDLDIWPEDQATKSQNVDRLVMDSGVQNREEELFTTSSGHAIWIETIKMPVLSKSGLIIGTTGIARDIHKRKTAEEALKESENRFYQLFHQNDDAIILFRLDTLEILDANPAAEMLTGFSRGELVKLSPTAIVAREDMDRLIQIIPVDSDSQGFQLERAAVSRKDRQSITAVIRGKIVRLRDEYVIYCSLRDITDKIHLEEEIKATQAKLIHTNKMTSLGMLAASIAHEINNPNNYIAVNASMLAEAWNDAVPILKEHYEREGDFSLGGLPYSEMEQLSHRLLIGISEGSRRIAAIIGNMKDFVRPDSGIYSEVDINKTIADASTILWNHVQRYTDNFRFVPGDNLPPARGNHQQLEQVIINLVTNALQALPSRERAVSIASSLDETGEMIVVTVSDEGVGMDQETLERVTEPFFSTRIDKGGTGLGLYITASMIKEHNGTLTFQSLEGSGSTATIRLPVARPVAPAIKQSAGELTNA